MKVEFKNGKIIEFSNLKEAEKYEKENNTKYVRIIKK